MLDDRTLRYLAAVSQAGSIRAAARELGVAPSAVQRTLAAAEHRIGWPIFSRGPGGAQPTEVGRVVIAHAQERSDLDAQLAADLSSVTAATEGSVSIAVGPGFVDQFSARVLTPFMTQYPGIRVRLVTGGTDALVADLNADEVSLAIALHPEPSPRLQILRSSEQPLGLICAPDHRLAGERLISPDQLAGERMAVLPRGYGLRALHDSFIRAHGVEVETTLESDNQPAIVAAVAAGRVVSLLPPVSVSRARAAGKVLLIPVDDARLSGVRAALVVRRGRRLSPAAKALLTACECWFDH
ncbi:LysR family transcriptional regulator [Ornithinimicrobium sp. Y1694]|uniref:LysR family transcriptional regulator n=1 Tax=Ornithinimicrobium sp. Y1694 TaxID=3418590 RepID=UPI003CFAD78C